jgi:hypothetical protein
MATHTSDDRRRRAAQAAAAYLYELLLTKKQYYQLWRPRDHWRGRPTRVDQDEVAWVLNKTALAKEGKRPPLRSDEYAQEYAKTVVRPAWKDKVSRALKGTALTRDTLELFIESFAMTQEHADRLRALFEGRERAAVAVGKYKRPGLDLYRYEHETVLLHEAHYVDKNGQPAKHRSVQNIRSIVPQMRSYQFRFFTDSEIDLEVVRGGVRGDTYHLDEYVQAIDIVLDEPLVYGETASLEYVTIFKSPTEYPLYFNRAVLQSVDSLEICVVFEKLPQRVFWAEWDGHEPTANIVNEERWKIQGKAVHRSLTHVEQAVFGFRWEW